MFWKLKEIDSNMVHDLTDGCVIGRTIGDIVFPNNGNLSKSHCQFSYKNNNLFVKDLESTNGTFVDSVRIAPQQPMWIKHGSILSIGSRQFMVEGIEAAVELTVIQPMPALTLKKTPEKLKFAYRGKHSDMIKMMITNIIFTMMTFGIYIPYARTNMRKMIWGATALGAYSFQFTGKARDLLRSYMVLSLFFFGYLIFSATLSIFVVKGNKTVEMVLGLGTYAVLGVILLKAKYGAFMYVMNHTSYRSISFNVKRSGSKIFLLSSLKGYLFTALSLGLYYPFHVYNQDKIKWSHASYGEEPFQFKGSGKEFAILFYKGFLLSMMTLGFYVPWFTISLHSYRMKNTHLKGASFETRATGGSYFWLCVKTSLLVICTLGLALPFMLTMHLAYFVDNLSIKGHVDFDQIKQGSKEKHGSLSDSVADVFDLDIA